MRTRLLHIWGILTSSYWFVPAIMMIAALLLAYLMLEADRRFAMADKIGWAYGGGVEGSRDLLAAVATSVITVAGVVFSITIVALNQASSQYGPRLLRNFMNDRGNQIVLGTFVSTFLYCLLVLREVRGGEDHEQFVPHLATTVATGMAIASLCVLIYFIHHVSQALQAPHVVARVVRDLRTAIARMYPERLGEGGAQSGGRETSFPSDFDAEAVPVLSMVSGHVQAVESDTLMRIASRRNLRVKLLLRPGRFIIAGYPLMLAWPPASVDEQVEEAMRGTYIIGHDRTPEQDVEFIIDQLVEIAVRSLSPSLNDPFTAVNCIDWLGVVLARLSECDEHSPYRYDDLGELRVIANVSNFSDFADEAFRQLRQNAAEKPAVLIRLLEMIRSLGQIIEREEHREALRRHAQLIEQQGREAKMNGADRADLEVRYRAAVESLRTGRRGGEPPTGIGRFGTAEGGEN